VSSPNSELTLFVLFIIFLFCCQEKIKEMEKLGDHLWMDYNYFNEANEIFCTLPTAESNSTSELAPPLFSFFFSQ